MATLASSPIIFDQPVKDFPHYLAATASEKDTKDFPCSDDVDLDPPVTRSYNSTELGSIQDSLRYFVPTELADMIMNAAELHPFVEVSRNAYTTAYSVLEAPDHDAQWCYLISPAVPSLTRNNAHLPTKVKNVKFFIKSYRSKRDAASSANPKIWFEAAILKANEPFDYVDGANPVEWYSSLAPRPKTINVFSFDTPTEAPPPHPLDYKERWRVISNPHTSPLISNSYDVHNGWHQIAWGSDDRLPHEDGKTAAAFVNALNIGDRVILFARAQTPGWVDQVYHARIEIDYCLNTLDD